MLVRQVLVMILVIACKLAQRVLVRRDVTLVEE